MIVILLLILCCVTSNRIVLSASKIFLFLFLGLFSHSFGSLT